MPWAGTRGGNEAVGLDCHHLHLSQKIEVMDRWISRGVHTRKLRREAADAIGLSTELLVGGTDQLAQWLVF